MEPTNVARTILEQLGGNRFLVMTGAHSLAAGAAALSFKLKTPKIKSVRVTLNASDTYTMEFFSRTCRVVSSFSDVYCDRLQAIFTQETGLYTSL